MAKLDSNNLDAIKDLIEVTVGEAIKTNGMVTKEDTNHLSTENEFFGKMDDAMGKLKAIREEQTVQSQMEGTIAFHQYPI